MADPDTIPEAEMDATEAIHLVAANSTWFENVQEHRFIFGLSRSLYLLVKRLLSVLRSEVDASGFDLTITDGRAVISIT